MSSPRCRRPVGFRLPWVQWPDTTAGQARARRIVGSPRTSAGCVGVGIRWRGAPIRCDFGWSAVAGGQHRRPFTGRQSLNQAGRSGRPRVSTDVSAGAEVERSAVSGRKRFIESVVFTCQFCSERQEWDTGRPRIRPRPGTCSRFIRCAGAPPRATVAPRISDRHGWATAWHISDPSSNAGVDSGARVSAPAKPSARTC